MITARNLGLSSVAILGLTAIAANLLAEPKGYNQNTFVTSFATAEESGCLALRHTKLTASERAIKARVAKSDSSNGLYEDPFFKAAKKDLKLNDEQAKRLFGDIMYWPKKYIDRYESAKTDKGRARAGYDRIHFFIDTNGTDVAPSKTSKS